VEEISPLDASQFIDELNQQLKRDLRKEPSDLKPAKKQADLPAVKSRMRVMKTASIDSSLEIGDHPTMKHSDTRPETQLQLRDGEHVTQISSIFDAIKTRDDRFNSHQDEFVFEEDSRNALVKLESSRVLE